MTTREKLKTLCDRLYDPATPAAERRDLSFEVSMLRCKLARVRDPLAAMVRGSGASDES